MTISRAQLLALDLVGPAEIGARLNVRPNTVAMWAGRFPDFPPPDLTISGVPVRRWNDVLTWAFTHNRARGQVRPEDLELAAKLLPKVKAQLAREVAACAAGVAHLLDEPLRRPGPRARKLIRSRWRYVDGEGNGVGEWDGFWQLPDDERARLGRHFSDSPTVCNPDQWAAAMLPGVDVGPALEQWRQATALKDAAAMLARGRLPLFDYQATTTYNVAAIFGPDGVTELARAWADERDRCEVSTSDNLPALAELSELESF